MTVIIKKPCGFVRAVLRLMFGIKKDSNCD